MAKIDPAHTTPHASASYGAPEHVQSAHTEIRTARSLSVERCLVAVDYDAALARSGYANTTIADAYLGVTESVVRRLRGADKPISLAHLSLGPPDVFSDVITRAAVRAFGVTGAIRFFAECTAEVAKGEARR